MLEVFSFQKEFFVSAIINKIFIVKRRLYITEKEIRSLTKSLPIMFI